MAALALAQAIAFAVHLKDVYVVGQAIQKRAGYLKTVLDSLPDGQTTFLQTTHGKPRSANGMGTAMRGWCDDAGLPQCSSHGLRKACSRRLIEAGATPHEMMAVSGHRTLAEAQKYAETFERSSAADRAMTKRRNAVNG